MGRPNKKIITSQQNDTLHNLYFSPEEPSAYSSVRKLYNAVRKVWPTLKYKDVESWLFTQEEYGAFRGQRLRHERRHYHVSEAFKEIEYDIIIWPKGWKRFQFPIRYTGCLVFIDCFRYVKHVIHKKCLFIK